MLIELEPHHCLGLSAGGTLAATATLLRYGTSLAWLGMVLTHPSYQRRGFARSLVSQALDLADASGIQTVKLDATEQGIGLYQSLGFERERPIERWSGNGQGQTGRASEDAADLAGLEALDREAFRADRSRLLSRLLAYSRSFTAPGGYLLQRPGARASYLGPCVAQSPAIAEQLLRRAVSDNSGPFFWDLFPDHSEAVGLATKLGFRAQRHLTRMYRGKPLRESTGEAYAIAGFELG